MAVTPGNRPRPFELRHRDVDTEQPANLPRLLKKSDSGPEEMSA